MRISTDIVVKVTGKTLSKHSAEKPMYIMATGADGTPVLQFESEAVAARLADSFVSQNINFNLVQSARSLFWRMQESLKSAISI